MAQALYCEGRVPEMPAKNSSAAAARAPYRVADSQRDYQMRGDEAGSSGSLINPFNILFTTLDTTRLDPLR